jgi:hypothetical protein
MTGLGTGLTVNINFKRLFLAVFLILILIATSCAPCVQGEGHPVPESKKIKPFTTLILNVDADVEIGVASKPVMQLHAQKNIAEKILIQQKGDRLIIDADGCIRPSDPLFIKLFTPSLEKIEVNGSGTVRTKQPVITNVIQFILNGSGKIMADVYANKVVVRLNGSGEVVVNGTSVGESVVVRGSGMCHTLGLRAEEVQVMIKGSGTVKVSAMDSLKTSINGSGKLIYSGTPVLDKEIKGSGTIEPLK